MSSLHQLRGYQPTRPSLRPYPTLATSPLIPAEL